MNKKSGLYENIGIQRNSRWVVEGRIESITNEQGVASFEWAFAGQTCEGEPCSGDWRIKAHYPGSTFYAAASENITLEVHYKAKSADDGPKSMFTPTTIMAIIIVLLGAAVAGVMYYQRVIATKTSRSIAWYFDRYNVAITGS